VGGNPTIRTLQSYARAVGMRLRLVGLVPENADAAATADERRQAAIL
jgi:hypothetical protein